MGTWTSRPASSVSNRKTTIHHCQAGTEHQPHPNWLCAPLTVRRSDISLWNAKLEHTYIRIQTRQWHFSFTLSDQPLCWLFRITEISEQLEAVVLSYPCITCVIKRLQFHSPKEGILRDIYFIKGKMPVVLKPVSVWISGALLTFKRSVLSVDRVK